VIKIDCTLVMITCSSDLNLMNKWVHLCSSLYNESWCFRVLKWAANIHIIWFECCDAFAYCWVMSMSRFIEFLIRFKRKLIKSNYICWVADIVFSWSNQSFFDSLFRQIMQYKIFSHHFQNVKKYFEMRFWCCKFTLYVLL